MTEQVAHPFGRAYSRSERVVERVNRASNRLGLLGFFGSLEHLRFVSPVFELAQLFYLFFPLLFVPFVLGAVRFFATRVRTAVSGGESPDDDSHERPEGWVESGYERSIFKRLQFLWLLVHPNIAVRGLFQLLGNLLILLRRRGDVVDADGYESDVDYRLPFDGDWTVLNGSPDPQYSHSWSLLQQRYAYDFVKTNEQGRTHDGSGGVESFYCFDEPVLAPADGTVVTVRDGHRDYHRTSGWFDPLQYRLVGNCVVIRHATDEYSVLAHLKNGSVRVSEGDTVERGEQIGRCGHSGNSTEPHLHFQVQDRANLYLGMGLPVAFSRVTTDHPDGERTRHDRTYVHNGQVVSHDTEA
ncbi:M23 family metallopeptidase [Halorussus halobius]|uniref:M23 family metallopeptidase n=1 Tax=Halorussus halobius TaxID=1710537 RepID=UPI001091D3DE|nr:M23 family metallopeptidase [Halorussus halobius]